MTAKRTRLGQCFASARGAAWLGALAAGMLGAPAALGQSPTVAPNPSPYSSGGGLVGAAQFVPPGQGGQTAPGGTGLGGGMGATPVNPPPSTSLVAPGMTQTLTAPPMSTGTGMNAGYAPGTVASPWVGGQRAGASAACCGPVGANGPIVYELALRTGPNVILGGGNELTGATNFGWMVAGTGRTLFLNKTNDAAWALEIGVGFIYNDGDPERVFDTFARRPLVTDPTTGAQSLGGPDELQPFYLRGLTRTFFSYAVGRDWFLNGPGTTGTEQGWNTRFGVDVGGRYGTVRADLVPLGDLDNYARRSGVAHTLTFGTHYTAEIPFGATILFTGARAEYGFTWSNVIPPQDGNIQDLSILLTLGVRF